MNCFLKEKYRDEIVPLIMKDYGLKSRMSVPFLEKICVNQGIGYASGNSRLIAQIADCLSNICGQKATVVKSKKSISNFKLRAGADVGCMVSLRGDRMYHFLYKVISIALPRVRDFSGVSRSGFDSRGIYNLGVRDQLIFPEVGVCDIEKTMGMNISIVIRNNCKRIDSKELSYKLLEYFGMPFKK